MSPLEDPIVEELAGLDRRPLAGPQPPSDAELLSDADRALAQAAAKVEDAIASLDAVAWGARMKADELLRISDEARRMATSFSLRAHRAERFSTVLKLAKESTR